MQCPRCGADIEDRTLPCPECGVSLRPWRDTRDPAPSRRPAGATSQLTVAALVATFAVIVLLLELAPAMRPAPEPEVVVVQESQTPEEEQEVLEGVIDRLYRAAASADTTAFEALVFPGARGGRRLALDEPTAPVVFTVTDADIGSGTAMLRGRESRAFLGKRGGEMVFTFQRGQRDWLITSWDPKETMLQSTIPETIRLNDVTSLDVVRTLLDARRERDLVTMRLLTTSRFQRANQDWFKDAGTAALQTHRVGAATKGDGRYTVAVTEGWDFGTRSAVYTVIKEDEQVLVEARATE